jgi:predicted DNA-binding transcriptional regulator YafY
MVADTLGVQLAAAGRHLKVLRELPGVRNGPNGGIQLDRTALLEPPSYPVVVAACLSNSLATLFRGTTYESRMREALAYLVAQSPRRSLFQNLDRKFVFVGKGGDASLADSREWLDEVIEGVLRSRRVRIRYTRFRGEETQLTVEPLTMAVYEHQLYVIGRSRADGVHPYRFSRILEADVEAAKFDYPKPTEYDPEELFAKGFGIYLGEGPTEDVVVRLAPSWRTYALNHRWHRTQRVEDAPDGVIVTINTRMTPEVIAWVLAFGSEVEVLSPPHLRAKIAEHVGRAATMYARDIERITGGTRAAGSPRTVRRQPK